MNDKILKTLTTTVGRLIFALLAGLGYFMVILRFMIEWSSGSSLLAFFFAPLIICGAALVLVKLMRQAEDAENPSAIIRLFWVHVVLFAIGIVFAVSMFL